MTVVPTGIVIVDGLNAKFLMTTDTVPDVAVGIEVGWEDGTEGGDGGVIIGDDDGVILDDDVVDGVTGVSSIVEHTMVRFCALIHITLV
jgi:hypothetical protein